MADPLNDLVATAVRAWASLAGASIESANADLIGLMELADTESGQFGFNEETVLVPAQPAACALSAGRFADLDDTPLRRRGRDQGLRACHSAAGDRERHVYGHAHG